MRLPKLLVLLPLLSVAAALFAVDSQADGRWDGSFTRKCHLVMDGGQQVCATSAASAATGAFPYVKTACTRDTAIGLGRIDGGQGNFCSLADGGQACELIRFTLGEKFYAQLTPQQNMVVAWSDGGSDNCDVFEAK